MYSIVNSCFIRGSSEKWDRCMCGQNTLLQVVILYPCIIKEGKFYHKEVFQCNRAEEWVG